MDLWEIMFIVGFRNMFENFSDIVLLLLKRVKNERLKA